MPDEGAPSGLSKKIDKKRKRQADDSAASKQDKSDAAPPPADAPNKKKKNAKKNKKEQSEQDVNRKDGVDESIGKMDGRLLADHFMQKAKKLDKELSAVELSDLSVPGEYNLILQDNSGANVLQILPFLMRPHLPRLEAWISFLHFSSRSAPRVSICPSLPRSLARLIHSW